MKIKSVEKLVKILENSIVREIEITDFWGRKIKISKTAGNTRAAEHHATPSTEMKKETVAKEETESTNLAAIRSPIVGTFYRSPAPDAPHYVEVGDIVKPGQVVCIVEAMKLMNEIESDVAGRVVKILVKNEDPVEYNQELMLIEPL
ncbi:MAG: acetyl-CoA carboxylase biotin carboxyl carrier protein [candidate division WOR-3 bacterium]|nr:MAG: acetyl-CoA carboxylase biotin carboxyl carrier protein [candidate division WOR-3 bacterium]